MAKKISGSVGKGGKNKPEDTKVVQELLNGFTKSCGFKKLDVDGLIGPKTNAAIKTFQEKAVGMAKADSRVDPGGKSLATLNLGPKKAEAQAKKEEKAQQSGKADAGGKEEKGGDSSKSKPNLKGDFRGLDKKIVEILSAVSAHYGKPIVIELGRQRESSGAGMSGEELWDNWTEKHVNRGKGDPVISRDRSLQKKLNQHFENTKKQDFLRLVAQKAGGGGGGKDNPHTTGKAFDIRKNTDSKVVSALATMLRKEDEGNLYHFDDTGVSLPRTINESVTKKWKK